MKIERKNTHKALAQFHHHLTSKGSPDAELFGLEPEPKNLDMEAPAYTILNKKHWLLTVITKICSCKFKVNKLCTFLHS